MRSAVAHALHQALLGPLGGDGRYVPDDSAWPDVDPAYTPTPDLGLDGTARVRVELGRALRAYEATPHGSPLRPIRLGVALGLRRALRQLTQP